MPQVVKEREGVMPELRKRRACLAVLGVFAMVASVLAVGASSVSAEPGKAEAAADYSACVGPATVDAGFTDVAAGSTHDAAINCIAYYGITRGTADGTFSPGETISRWQLAVMLQRAAGPAGVELGAAADQGFTDVSDLGSAFQAAVNQVAAAGIMAGTTATTFDPDGVVSRSVIVEALAGFLTNARVGPGGKVLSRDQNRTLTVKPDASPGTEPVTIDESFRDLGGVTYSAFQSIRALAEMGVVQGRGDGTFGPAASVTRGQAASFITRALAHTNARPAGLTVQAEMSAVASGADFDLSVSLRDGDFAPVESAPVDFFSYAAKNAAAAFKTDGTCNTSPGGVSDPTGGGSDACVIEIDDDVTEPDGNLSLEPDSITAETVYWVWSGAVGDKLDWDATAGVSMDNTAVSNAASITIGTVTTPSEARVSLSVSSDADGRNTVRYGTTVTVTIQLVDSSGNDIGIAGQTYSWYAEGDHTEGSTAVQLAGTGTRTVTTDSGGRASFTLAQADPDTNPAGGDNDKTTWTYRITAVGTATALVSNNNSMTGIGFTVTSGTGTGTVVFDDDDGKAQKVSIELQRTWTPRPASGAVGSVGVTAKVTDQYGDPLRGHDVYFDLDGDGTFGCQTWVSETSTCTTVGTGDTTIDMSTKRIDGATRRTTRSNGTNTISATFPSASPPVGSHFTYRVAANLSGTANFDVADPDEIATATHYWVYDPPGWNSETGIAPAGPDGQSVTNDNGNLRRIHLVDYDNNVIIRQTRMPGNATTPVKNNLWRYRDGDIFWWYVDDGSGDPDAQGWRYLSAAEFESYMARHMAQGGVADGATPYASFYASVVAVEVRQYSTVTGFSVFRVVLKTGDDIADLPTP